MNIYSKESNTDSKNTLFKESGKSNTQKEREKELIQKQYIIIKKGQNLQISRRKEGTKRKRKASKEAENKDNTEQIKIEEERQ